uniref:Uncharacterized protein n=1 Tax=Arundo donax TaxID=35708 RepID=A0A0A8Y571_ARUDO
MEGVKKESSFAAGVLAEEILLKNFQCRSTASFVIAQLMSHASAHY